MAALSHRKWLVAVVGLALGSLSSACSVSSTVDTAAGGCVQGQSEACACDNGSVGVRICEALGVFGSCECGPAPIPGGAGGFTPPIGGAAGSAGIDVGEDPGKAGASAGSDPVVDAGGTAGAAGSGGVAGGDDRAGTGGTGGMMGGTGAAGDAADGGIDETKPGEAYNECRDDGSCDLPMFCVLDALSGGAQRYCAPVCSGNGAGGLSCPRRRDGSRSFCVRNICMR